jgi:replication initiation and membrane attachment protein DnaB
VNVLIEYVLGTNENRLSRGYCEAIGSSWARKNIVNVKQAYEEAMMNKNEPVIIEDKKEEHVDASHEFDDLLSQLKEGKL